MDVTKGSTSGRKRRDFVTERTNSGSEKSGLARRAFAFVNLCRQRWLRASSGVPPAAQFGYNAMIEKELDTV